MIPAIVLFALTYVLMLIFWIRGKRAWKKSQEYMDYMTLKRAIRDEKKR